MNNTGATKGHSHATNRMDFDKEAKLCAEFLNEFEDISLQPDSIHGRKKYVNMLQRVTNGEQTLVNVYMEDLESFFTKVEHQALLEHIVSNTKRYIKLFGDAADDIQSRLTRTTTKAEAEEYDETLNSFRLANLESKNNAKPPKEILNLLRRKFELAIVLGGPNSKIKLTKLRDLKANLIGSLVNVRAMVVRVSEVKPLISVACYVCEACGCEIYQQINRRVYTPSIECPSNICQTNNTKGRVIPNFAVSKFVPYQEIKIQETSDQTPIGSIPRSFTVQCRGELARKCTPGDIISLCAIFLPKVNDSQMSFRDNLVHDTYLEAAKVEQEKKRYTELYLNDDVGDQIAEESAKEGTYSKLANSICPEIFGLENVKKALLLQMVSGSTLVLTDGMRIRGDINIALIGDPGVAKSQLLKHIAHLTPRGIYTSGKGSSGAGLTAAVMRDQFTHEIMLEGGALVLADMGICCIDEFDKMEEKDRTSIHEVMEQQSVSIAKAGITTTLNARTSILAAANPVFGRYNRARTPHENINLPPSLLSRFDLIFILLDRPDDEHDFRMASHITYVHQNLSHPKNDKELFESSFLRNYIAFAKKFNPTIRPELHAHLAQKYVDKRQKLDKDQAKTTYSYTTPRSLLAVIRLSQALAKLRLSENVSKEDIEEALFLMEESQRSVIDQSADNNAIKTNGKRDPVSLIYQMMIKELKANSDQTMSYNEFEKKVVQKGLPVSELKKCITQYESLNTIMLDEDREIIRLV